VGFCSQMALLLARFSILAEDNRLVGACCDVAGMRKSETPSLLCHLKGVIGQGNDRHASAPELFERNARQARFGVERRAGFSDVEDSVGFRESPGDGQSFENDRPIGELQRQSSILLSRLKWNTDRLGFGVTTMAAQKEGEAQDEDRKSVQHLTQIAFQ